HLREHDQSGRVVGMDDIARIDQANAGDAVKRRGDRRVTQLCPRRVDGGLVGFHRVLQLRHLRRLSIYLLARGVALLEQRLKAAEICLSVVQVRLIATTRRGHLIDLCLEGAWIDLRENLPALYLLSLGEIDLLKCT